MRACAPASSLGESVKAVRGALPAESHLRSLRKGLASFVSGAVIYWATFITIALVGAWPARLALAMANGLAIGIIFIVGHDACHGSLTPQSKLNKWLGRLAFLPSLHPYAAWEYSHNALHHGWTNLRGKDPVYCPRTVDEFRALSPGRQRLERAYRTWLGILLLYLIEIWWSLEIVPKGHHRAHIEKRGTFGFDRALVMSFPFVQAAVLIACLCARHVPHAAWPLIIVVGLVVPFLTFTWLIGFATFQHHTHPRVLWYDDERTWSFFRSQVQGTVHIVFPRWIELLLQNIMEHTAHHVDTKIPLYNLTNAQRAIEAAYGEENVIVEPFSFRGMQNTFRVCQLYDYTQHKWLSFTGEPTTSARSLDAEADAFTGVSVATRGSG